MCRPTRSPSAAAPRLVRFVGRLAIATACLTTPLAAQTSSFSSGTIHNADPLTTFTTFGKDMLGLKVTWTFTDGTFDSGTFGSFNTAGNDLAAGVNKNGLQLGLLWFSDTFLDLWFVSNNTGKSVSSIQLNGQPGKVVFDCGWTSTGCAAVGNPSGQVGSENSAQGHTFQANFFSEFQGPVAGHYTNLVGLSGGAPVGDIFEQFTMTFAEGFGTGNSFGFKLDTDNTSGMITERQVPPPVTAVPEPASVALLAAGIGALAVAQRRRAAS